MIRVERRESELSQAEADAIFAELDARPGIWMGCDVEVEGQYRRSSIACAVAALRFCVDGPVLLVTPFGTVGAGLLGAVRSLAEFEDCAEGVRVRMPDGMSVFRLLREFLGLFQPACAELALYGALSFDYYRFGLPDPLPVDERRRLTLFLPKTVQSIDNTVIKRIDFRFLTLGQGREMRRAALTPTSPGRLQDELPPGGHAARVAQGVDLLKKGELYSLVLSQVFRRPAGIPASQAFASLRRRNPYPGMFFCNLDAGEMLFGASPDVQVRADADWVESSPVCGTISRGTHPAEDAERALLLFASPKEAAALALCADSALEELSAVCELGTVEVLSHRRLHFFSTIIHTIAHLRGRRRKDVDAFDILLSHATPATVTGLPKHKAVQAIDHLEPEWRGWYAGAVVRIGSDGSVEAYTVLRAARIVAGIAEVRAGGNILADSDPESEEEETRLKAQSLFRVLSGNATLRAPECGSRGFVRGLYGQDEFRHSLSNTLERAGLTVSPRGIVAVLSGPAREDDVPEAPLVAIGGGAVWLLQRHGARVESFPVPEFARVRTGRASPEGFLKAIPQIRVGWYHNAAIRHGGLPAGWQEVAVSDDGWVLAAQHRDERMCALFFRPESVLSGGDSNGVAALRAAVAWLDPCDMFVQVNVEEKS
ncbi:MAG: chorismate-binding protein [Burkholderiales bacterium]